MDIAELIDSAKRKTGTLGKVAMTLGVHQARLSEWRSGVNKPPASTIARLAEMAELPVLETVAACMARLHPEAEGVWLRALGKFLKIKTYAGEQLTFAFDMRPQIGTMFRRRENSPIDRRRQSREQ